jgi:Ca2+-binding EF-hand superfamily protein
MKTSLISLLVAGLFAGTATVALAQNVTADKEKPDATSQSANPAAKDQKEMSDPSNDAQAAANPGDAAFKKADKDHDGTLDRTEAKDLPNVAKNFDKIDTDKDGTVSLDEVHTAMKTRKDAAKN